MNLGHSFLALKQHVVSYDIGSAPNSVAGRKLQGEIQEKDFVSRQFRQRTKIQGKHV